MSSIAGAILAARNVNERWRMERSATYENSARLAQSTSTLRTFGVGSIIIAAPLVFDTPFVAEPAVMSGFALVKASNPVFQLPLAAVGVRQWIKERQLYTAALVYVSVYITELPDGLRPLKPAEYETGEQALAAAQALGLPADYVNLVAAVGPGSMTNIEKGILAGAWDEQSVGWMKQVTIVHSITFSGTAIKNVPTAGVDDDVAATPRSSPLGT